MSLSVRSSGLNVAARSSRITRSRVVLRATEEPATVETASPSGRSVQNFSLLNSTNEAINGRAAMMGFVSAVAAEALTHHSVFSQVAGKYENQELVEKAFGASALGFGMIVALVTMGTLAPRLLDPQSVDNRAFGPFTPGLEKTLGRVAMLGFSGLLLVEAIKGSSLL